MRMFTIGLTLLMSLPALAQQDAAPLGFREWKDQQVLDAQNQVLRASTRVGQFKSGKSSSTIKKSARLPNDKVRESSEDEGTAAERDLKHAQDGLVAANALSFANYIDVYLPSLRDNPAALQKLSEKLSKDELSEIFRALMRSSRDAESRRTATVLQALVVGGGRAR